ncbi:UmoC family flagellar biogenesis regulator [Pseudochrobactrum sp. HB0163]|uniref:UmoC family flagellar biogenesis regulator n=1 Tax=Pseudochrobactrum sp. HB0163 TaxID=3450708 RepID=UPI003F6DB1CF
MHNHISKYSLLIAALLVVPTAFSASAAETPQQTGALDHCYTIIGSKPRTELQGCLQEQQKIADEKLKTQFEKTRRAIEETGSSSVKTAIRSLKKSQKAFLRFRDAECKRIGDAALGGSGAGDMQQGCMIDLTNWRIHQLAK